MTTSFFILFVLVTLAGVISTILRFIGKKPGLALVAGLSAWLLYVGLISYFGLVRNSTMRPPGAAFLFGPLLIYLVLLIFLTRSPKGDWFVSAVPLRLLLGAQVFRVGVELFLHQLWHDGLIPQMLTFSGANVDIYIGATAPVITWLAGKNRIGLRIAQLWNVLGLLALANVVVRAVLTTPGPLNLIHAEVPDLMIGTFPYTFVPGFFVPLAVTMHVLALRATTRRLKSSQ